MNETPAPRIVLIVMAHPDDGEFMCGAAIARWAREGCQLHYCVATSGDVGSRDPAMTRERLAELRRDEAREAARRLGCQNGVTFLNYADSLLTPSLDLRRDVTRVIRQTRPDVVVTQDPTTFWHGQSYINHPDHRAIGEATLGAVMPAAGIRLIFPELDAEGLATHDVGELYLTNTVHADRWVEVTKADMERQIDALRAHVSQITTDPAEYVEADAKEEAAEARRHGHDFTYAQGFKYFRFRR